MNHATGCEGLGIGYPSDGEGYDLLAEWDEDAQTGLVPDEEGVECPECGDEFDGRRGLKAHVGRTECGEALSDSDSAYISKEEIHKEIADSCSFRTTTVKDLIQVAQIPDEFEPFVKIPEDPNYI